MLTSKRVRAAKYSPAVYTLVAALQPTIENRLRVEMQTRHMADVTYSDTLEQLREQYASDEELAERLSGWPTDTVENLTHIVSKQVDSGEAAEIILTALNLNEGFQIVSGMVFLEKLFDTYADVMDPDDSYLPLRGIVGGLTRYEHLGFSLPYDVFNCSVRDALIVNALAALRLALGDLNESKLGTDSSTNDTYIEDDGLVRLAIDHPVSASRIIELMEQRHLFDAEALRSIIGSDAQALSDGFL